MIRLEPQTTVGSLLRAIPSTAIAFEKFEISTGESAEKSLHDVCVHRGIALEEFLRTIDEIDWTEESVHYEPVNGNGNKARQDTRT